MRRARAAVALRLGDCYLPSHGWGMLTLAAAAPRSAAAWTSGGTSHEQRGLKHRPDGAVRPVPIPAVLVHMLRAHLRCHGTAPDGRLFPGTRGGLLSESVYGRAWHAARAGHSVTVLLTVYTHCVDGQDQITNRLIEHSLRPSSTALCPKASCYANRYHHFNPVRYMSVDRPARPGMARTRPGLPTRTTSPGCPAR